jgi:hypothetical protein
MCEIGHGGGGRDEGIDQKPGWVKGVMTRFFDKARAVWLVGLGVIFIAEGIATLLAGARERWDDIIDGVVFAATGSVILFATFWRHRRPCSGMSHETCRSKLMDVIIGATLLLGTAFGVVFCLAIGKCYRIIDPGAQALWMDWAVFVPVCWLALGGASECLRSRSARGMDLVRIASIVAASLVLSAVIS